MSKFFLFLIPIAFLIGGCGDWDEDMNPDDKDFVKNRLPHNAKNVNFMGNNWITFTLFIDGKERKFLYHAKSLDSQIGHETITELH